MRIRVLGSKTVASGANDRGCRTCSAASSCGCLKADQADRHAQWIGCLVCRGKISEIEVI